MLSERPLSIKVFMKGSMDSDFEPECLKIYEQLLDCNYFPRPSLSLFKP